ncbi:MAG: hypothetical protein HYS12_07685 [Planctomycetes bacterium]|nr:hypothetical protein [Planctomycetota bacterium]
MRALNFDGQGTAWIGLVEKDRRKVVKADPLTGKAEQVLVTSEPSSDKLYIDNVVPVGDELFVCGGWYPRQILIDSKTGKSRGLELKKPGPEVFNALVVGGTVYSFDGNNGIYAWKPGEWSSELIPWPKPGKGPFAGVYVSADHSLYCPMWWQQGMAPTQPLLRYDLKAKKWTTLDAPWPSSKPMLPVEVNGKLYVADMFGGHLMVFDVASQKFEARYALPGYGKQWKYLATFNTHGPFVVCVLSTFAGAPNANKTFGFDGNSHHFVNRIMMFDTRDGAAAMVPVPSLSGEGYATIAYLQPRGDSMYLTCVDSPRVEARPKTERGAAYLVEMQLSRLRK